MPSALLLSSGAFDRSALLRAAWSDARATVADAVKRPTLFGRRATLREAFAFSLRRTWARAKAERDLIQWRREAPARDAAEAVRRSTLTDHARRVEDAATAVLMAECNDTVISTAIVAHAHAHLRLVQAGA